MSDDTARLQAAAQTLARILGARPQGRINVRWATVTAVNVGPPKTVDIVLGGTAIPAVAYTASYTPTVADVVRVEIIDLVAFVTDKRA